MNHDPELEKQLQRLWENGAVAWKGIDAAAFIQELRDDIPLPDMIVDPSIIKADEPTKETL